MAVDGRRTVPERQVERPPVAAGRNRHARNIAVGHGHQRMALLAVGLDVHTGVEVSRAQFTEIGRKEPRSLLYGKNIIVGIEPLPAVRSLGLSRGPGARRGQKHRCQKSSHVSVSLTNCAAASITAS